MASFEDKGSIIDAPLDAVWKYLASEEHGAAHARNARNFRVRETIGVTSVVAAERKLAGQWSPFVSRSSAFPPLCIVNEEIEGDFAGSRFVIIYTPEGNVTRVDVVGDVESKVFPPGDAKRIFLELLQGAYEDDSYALSQIARAVRVPAPTIPARSDTGDGRAAKP